MKLQLKIYVENDKRDENGQAVEGWQFWERELKLQELGPEHLPALKQLLEDLLKEAWESQPEAGGADQGAAQGA
jgi:hypothetical protein